MNKILLALTAVALLGCVAVPQTKINLKNGTFSSPKDDSFSNVVVDFNSNGVTHLSIGAANGANNPAVISATAAGQVSIQNSYIGGILDGMRIAATYFSGQGGGGGLVPQVPIPILVPTNAPPTNAPK